MQLPTKAWTFQDPKQVKKHGEDKGKRLAEKKREKIAASLISGTYQDKSKATWQEFRQEYDAHIILGLSVRTREEVVAGLTHFERIVGPKRMSVLVTSHIDQFIAHRRKDRGKSGSPITAGFASSTKTTYTFYSSALRV